MDDFEILRMTTKWVTANKVSIPICQLTDTHLQNILNKFKTSPLEKIQLLKIELVYRVNNGISVSESPSVKNSFHL